MGLDIPIWGQYSFGGLLIGLLLFVVLQIIRGELIPKSRQDQINAEHAADKAAEQKRHEAELAAVRAEAKEDLDRSEERSRKWQEAWQAGQNLAAQQTDAIARLTTVAEVMEAFLKALPVLPGGDDES